MPSTGVELGTFTSSVTDLNRICSFYSFLFSFTIHTCINVSTVSACNIEEVQAGGETAGFMLKHSVVDSVLYCAT